jgi:PPOX class probable F420-dependent enzyme
VSVDPTTLEAFLAGRYLAVVSTYRPDGTVQMTANWYIAESGAVYLPTFEQSYKVKNVRRDPRAAVLVDSRGSGPMRAAATNGPADIVEGDEAMAISVRCWERYLTPAGMEHPGVGGLLRSHDPVCVRIEPGSWSWTDQGDVFDGLLESPELVLPHSD